MRLGEVELPSRRSSATDLVVSARPCPRGRGPGRSAAPLVTAPRPARCARRQEPRATPRLRQRPGHRRRGPRPRGPSRCARSSQAATPRYSDARRWCVPRRPMASASCRRGAGALEQRAAPRRRTSSRGCCRRSCSRTRRGPSSASTASRVAAGRAQQDQRLVPGRDRVLVLVGRSGTRRPACPAARCARRRRAARRTASRGRTGTPPRGASRGSRRSHPPRPRTRGSPDRRRPSRRARPAARTAAATSASPAAGRAPASAARRAGRG